MPAKNSIKPYLENGYYHIYNRGTEKREIFRSDQDYKVFLSYLRECLSPVRPLTIKIDLKDKQFSKLKYTPKNFFSRIKLLSYCLMPNHFHLLIHQKDPRDIKEFMHSLTTRYSAYFNKQYDRVGRLFQGIYKATLVENDEYLLHLTRYIHLNPLPLIPHTFSSLTSTYSSYPNYLGNIQQPWVDPTSILARFSQINNAAASYRAFVENKLDDSNQPTDLLQLAIDPDD